MNTAYLATMAIETLSELCEARQRWVSAAIALVDAERNLNLANAIARQAITEAAGGAKALGSNADLREMALIQALTGNLGYVTALARHDEAFEQEARAKQEMYGGGDALKLFEILLETDAFANPVLVDAVARSDLVVSDATPLWEGLWLPLKE